MDEERPSPSADLAAGVIWLVLAAAILVGAWQMDRLTHLQATIHTAPGLVPGLLSLSMMLMSLLLIGRAVRAGAIADWKWPRFHVADHWRLLVGLFLCLGFAIGLVGHGLPFWLAAAVFVSVFVFIYQFEDRKAARTLPRGAAVAVIVGLISGLAIHYMFQDLFLVRLP